MSTQNPEIVMQAVPPAVITAARAAMSQIADKLDERYRKELEKIKPGETLESLVGASSVGNDPGRSLLTKLIFGASEGTSVLDQSHIPDIVLHALEYAKPISMLYSLTSGPLTPNQMVTTIKEMFQNRDSVIKDFVANHKTDLDKALAAASAAGGVPPWERHRRSDDSAKVV